MEWKFPKEYGKIDVRSGPPWAAARTAEKKVDQNAVRAAAHGGPKGENMDYFTVELTDTQLQNLSSLALAHLGDAVYELMARTYLVSRGRETNHGLHRATVVLVQAPAQAAAAAKLLPLFTEEEAAVYKRGRNAKTHAIPHGATLQEYHAATALEAVFGYLYLKGRRERLNQLFAAIMEDGHGI